MTKQFYGKYRGIVTDTDDKLRLGRLRAIVPDVTGDQETGWALPCVPYAGEKFGLFALPKAGSKVWIEFENGDPDFPVWTGCFWGSKEELPKDVLSDPEKIRVFETPGGHRIVFDDNQNGGIRLETSGGQKIVVDGNGIQIEDGNGGKIKISGGKVSVNDDALEVI